MLRFAQWLKLDHRAVEGNIERLLARRYEKPKLRQICLKALQFGGRTPPRFTVKFVPAIEQQVDAGFLRYRAEIVFGGPSAKGHAAQNGIEQRLVFGRPVRKRHENGRFAVSNQSFRDLQQRRCLAHAGWRDEDQIAKFAQCARERGSLHGLVQLRHLHCQCHVRGRPSLGATEHIDIGGCRRMQSLRKFAFRDFGGPRRFIVENAAVRMLFRLLLPVAQQLDGELWIVRVDRLSVQLAHPDPVFRGAAFGLAHSGIKARAARRGGADVGCFA
ncbi:hypothetical protein [Methylocystis sp. MJC1]|uniref:hypothetical protein n=1 Tax=Methylocystis sp. MJC1 TaxID=2654282 RepID=UPI0020A6A839|nr:hypothetical protein [Methylocystis sp. MJC1]